MPGENPVADSIIIDRLRQKAGDCAHTLEITDTKNGRVKVKHDGATSFVRPVGAWVTTIIEWIDDQHRS